MWISHGYIHPNSSGNKSVEEIGSEYFDNLLSRSFIQAREGIKFVLHDLLHDLAESVSENEYLKINLKQTKEITGSVRHLHVHSNDLSLLKSCDLRNLRTLIIDGNKSDDYSVLKEVLNGLKSIRVLILNNVSEQLLSGSIGQLTHLRYLAVYSKESGESLVSGEGAAALPAATNSMVSLRPYHLQWLISGKGGLALPAATKYLVSLRHFGSRYYYFTYDIWKEIATMSGIGKLTCLQELERFLVGKTEGRKLAELKRLNELKGTLRLECLDNASTKEEALEANLNKKEGIRELVLRWDDGHAPAQMAEEVLEGLCPPPYIKKLSLHSYLGVESPTWMLTVNGCLSVLQSLTLCECWNWKVLPPLGQLPLLRFLKISGANAVEEIGSSFYGSGAAVTFPCLEALEFNNMIGWVVWSRVEENTESLFPRLRDLTVMKCRKLERVPMQCLASVEVLKTSCIALLVELEKLTSLKELEVIHCEEMQSLALLPASLVSLNIQDCDQLSSLFTTETETKLPSLRKITIFRCPQLVSAEMKSLPSLQKLKITHCETIQSVPLLPATLAELEIEYCYDLTAFGREQEENLSDLTSLRKITINICPRLHSLPHMPASLQKLEIKYCHELHCLPLMPASLQDLRIDDCPQLHSLPLMPSSLQQLRISNCPQLHSLPLMPASLQQLRVSDCPQLHSLPLMPASLQQLKISLCPRLHSLPLLPASLQQLVILVCPKLPRERYQEGGEDWHKISHVPDIDW